MFGITLNSLFTRKTTNGQAASLYKLPRIELMEQIAKEVACRGPYDVKYQHIDLGSMTLAEKSSMQWDTFAGDHFFHEKAQDEFNDTLRIIPYYCDTWGTEFRDGLGGPLVRFDIFATHRLYWENGEWYLDAYEDLWGYSNPMTMQGHKNSIKHMRAIYYLDEVFPKLFAEWQSMYETVYKKYWGILDDYTKAQRRDRYFSEDRSARMTICKASAWSRTHEQYTVIGLEFEKITLKLLCDIIRQYGETPPGYIAYAQRVLGAHELQFTRHPAYMPIRMQFGGTSPFLAERYDRHLLDIWSPGTYATFKDFVDSCQSRFEAVVESSVTRHETAKQIKARIEDECNTFIQQMTASAQASADEVYKRIVTTKIPKYKGTEK